MSTVQTILDRKPPRVWDVGKSATVLEAARLMNEHRIGALVVTEGDRVTGIFSERDVLIRVVAAEVSPSQVRVGDVMTSPVAVCTPTTTLNECRTVMRDRRIRHLPVVDGEKLIGMVSIGDLSATAEEESQATIRYLYEYMHAQR